MIVITMVKLITAMALGFLLARRGVLTPDSTRSLSRMIVLVTCPALILNSVANMPKGQDDSVIGILIAGAVFYVVVPAIGYIYVRLLGVPQNLRGISTCMMIFANSTFMGFPVVEALYGKEAVFLSAIFHLGFNLLFFTVGEHIIARDAGRAQKFHWRDLLSPGIITAMFSLVVYFGKIKLPDAAVDLLDFLGGVTIPLAMISVGSSIAFFSFQEIFRLKGLAGMSLARLLGIPLVLYAILLVVLKDATLAGVAAVTTGMPVASLVGMGSAAYPEQNRAATIGVAATTVFSIFTIPLLIWLMTLVQGAL